MQVGKCFTKLKESILSIPKIVWIIVLVGFFLRFFGVWYGLPLFLNIDEPTLVSSSIAIKENINPGHFDWPHLFFYMNAIVYALFSIIRKLLDAVIGLPDIWFSPVPLFLISRCLSLAMGTATVIAVYILTKDIYSKRVGYIAALLIAVLPVHVYESHFAKPDIAQTLFTTIALVFIYRVYLNAQLKNFVLAGIFIGLSTSIKYGGALMYLPLLLAYILNLKGGKYNDYIRWDNFKKLVISGITGVTFFYLGTPFALFDYKKFFSYERAVGALWQFKNVGKSTWADYPFELYETFVPMYQENLGYFIWILFLIILGLFLFFNRRDDKSIFLLLPTIIFTLYISKLNRSPDHYFVFLIPLYIPAIAKLIEEISMWVSGFLKRKSSLRIKESFMIGLITFIFILPSFFSSFHSSLLFSRKDTRNLAYDWIQENLEEYNNEDFLYVHGEDLAPVPFKRTETEKITKIDRSRVKESPPFYVVFGVKGITKESVTEGKRDPEELEGNSEPIFKNAKLVFYADDTLRIGPPIYIFKVDYIEPDE